MQNSIIQYLLDKHLTILDSYGQKFSLYKKDINIIKTFDGFKLNKDGTYWYKGHNIIILEEMENNNAE